MSETASREARVRAAFTAQADWACRLDAPFTRLLCDTLGARLDRTTAVGRRVLDWPGAPIADALALRLVGGLHALVKAGEAPDLAAFYPPNPLPEPAALTTRLAAVLADDRLLPWLDTAPQTNEVARSGVLMPGLMTVAAATGLPLRLFELGASAGLNLRLDRYRYNLGGVDCGPTDAAVTLTPDWEGSPPPRADVRVVARRGVDLNPLDVRDATARERLLAYVWPDQPARSVRLAAAITAYTVDPVPIDRADAAPWVEANVGPASGTATVVFHSIAFQYFPRRTQSRIAAHMVSAGAAASPDAPLAWLRFEMDDDPEATLPALRLTLWPGATDRLLARAHPHAVSVQWLG